MATKSGSSTAANGNLGAAKDLGGGHSYQSAKESFQWLARQVELGTNGTQIEAVVAVAELRAVLEVAEGMNRHLDSLLKNAALGQDFDVSMGKKVAGIRDMRAELAKLESQLEQLQRLDDELAPLQAREKELQKSIELRLAQERELELRKQELQRREQLEATRPDMQQALQVIDEEIAGFQDAVDDRDSLIRSAERLTATSEGLHGKVEDETHAIVTRTAEAINNLREALNQRDILEGEAAEIEAEADNIRDAVARMEEEIQALTELRRQVSEAFNARERDWQAHLQSNREVARALGITATSMTLEAVEQRLSEIDAMIDNTSSELKKSLELAQHELGSRYEMLGL